jgi:hypothetical protein
MEPQIVNKKSKCIVISFNTTFLYFVEQYNLSKHSYSQLQTPIANNLKHKHYRVAHVGLKLAEPN